MDLDPRHCFQVKRYHTFPTLQSQTVGEHTCQVLRIYSEMFGPPSAEVVQGILWHDAGELWTGDVPFDAKRAYPELRIAVSSVDDQAVDRLSGGRFPRNLPGEYRKRIKVCDLAEMAEFGMEEALMGNAHYGHVIRSKVVKAIFDLLKTMSAQDATDFEEWAWRRKLHLGGEK